jgi:hypothetical protein
MEKEILFSEKQKFAHPVLWMFTLPFIAFFTYAIVQQMILGNPLVDYPMSNTKLVLSTCLLSSIVLFFYFNNLETQIKKDGVYVKYSPYDTSFKFFAWEKISKCYVRTYSPLLEYGGFGLRSGKSGAAYNVSGEEGLQLEFQNKSKLLIGTQKPEEITAILIKINKV